MIIDASQTALAAGVFACGQCGLAEVNGYAQTIKEAGAHLLNSACPLVCARTAYDIVKTGFVADGAKQAHYVHTDLNEKNCKVFYGSTKRCVEAAIKGRWEA